MKIEKEIQNLKIRIEKLEQNKIEASNCKLGHNFQMAGGSAWLGFGIVACQQCGLARKVQ